MFPILGLPVLYAPLDTSAASSAYEYRLVSQQACSASSGGGRDWDAVGDREMYCQWNVVSPYSVADSKGQAITDNLLAQQYRYEAIERSFKKHSKDFSEDKRSYFREMANRLCRLPFVDNVASYNPYDETLDSRFYFQQGLSLSVSQLLDDAMDAPVLFSLHRNSMLLVSDELPLDELVDTLNEILAEESNGSKA